MLIKNMLKTYNTTAIVAANKQVSPNVFLLTLEAPEIAKAAKPGQFVEIKVSSGLDPLLRRPLSIHATSGVTIDLLYAVVGKATALLTSLKAKERCLVIGPLGNGFAIDSRTLKHQPLLIGGGIGIAPLYFLACELVKHASIKNSGKPVVIIGAKTKSCLLSCKQFKDLGCQVEVTTDDGSSGFKGYSAHLIDAVIKKSKKSSWTIFSCGPHRMLHAVYEKARTHQLDCYVSLEAHMACGIGACLGCVVKTNQGFKRVCSDGPVFNAKDLVWSTEE